MKNTNSLSCAFGCFNLISGQCWIKCRVKFIIPVSSLIIIMMFFLSCNKKDSSNLKVCNYALSSAGLKTVRQAERDLPVVGQADVVVAGGGVAGVAAALSAAEQGMSVIIIESRNYFGYELTATNYCRTGNTMPGPDAVISRVICEELKKNGMLVEGNLNPLALRNILLRKINERPEIKVFLYSLANDVVCDGKRVRGVVFSGRDGKQAVLARVVIDATEDARIASAAGAKFIRTYKGEKTARRFISLKRPSNLSVGTRSVSPHLGLRGDSINVYDNYIELTIETEVGADIAADLSNIQAKTFEKSFKLLEWFENEGINPDNYIPGAETWIDEMPVVVCRGKLSSNETAAVDFYTKDAIKPAGTNGLLITGRTVDISSDISSLQVLLALGEFAGRTAGAVASEVNDFNRINIPRPLKEENKKGLRICSSACG